MYTCNLCLFFFFRLNSPNLPCVSLRLFNMGITTRYDRNLILTRMCTHYTRFFQADKTRKYMDDREYKIIFITLSTRRGPTEILSFFIANPGPTLIAGRYSKRRRVCSRVVSKIIITVARFRDLSIIGGPRSAGAQQ